jgi:hypothetical protein
MVVVVLAPARVAKHPKKVSTTNTLGRDDHGNSSIVLVSSSIRVNAVHIQCKAIFQTE